MKPAFTILACMPLLLASCAKDAGRTVTKERVSHGDALLDKYASNHGYAKTGGMVKSTSDKKSEYSGRSFNGTSDFAGRDYTTKGYTTKNWGGNTSYANKAYKGGTKYDNAPEYAKRLARYNGMSKSTTDFSYRTSKINRTSALEQGSSRMVKTDSRYAKRHNLEDPIIIPWQQQNNMGYSVDQTNQMLGRASEESR